MKKLSSFKISAMRTTALVAAFGLIGFASADLKFSVTVATTGVKKISWGLPQAGQYEIDFRTNQARIVQPNGTILIFDFKSAQVAVINQIKKTYVVQSLQEILKPKHTELSSAQLALDTSSGTQSAYGSTAYRFAITSKAMDTNASPPQSNTGESGTPQPSFLPSQHLTPQLGRQNSPYLSVAGHPGTQNASSQYNLDISKLQGSGWIADGTGVKGTITSIAPLVLVSAPASLVSSLTDDLNSKGGIPISLSLAWNNRENDSISLEMTVDGVEALTLDDDLFEVPRKYTLATTTANR